MNIKEEDTISSNTTTNNTDTTNTKIKNTHLLIPINLDNKSESSSSSLSSSLSKKKSDECIELKTLKYKSMILKGSNFVQSVKKYTSAENIDILLEKEKADNDGENWIKLSKSDKLKLMKEFAKKYITDNSLTEIDEENLINFFKDCIDRKKLNKSKDIKYDKNSKTILDIYGLILNSNKKFTIKNNTTKSASSSLTPKKKVYNNGTIKYKNDKEDNYDNEDEDED